MLSSRREIDEATFRPHLFELGPRVLKDRLERFGDVVTIRIGFLTVVRQSVVHWTTINEIPFIRINHQHFGRSRESQHLADELTFVVKNGEIDVPR